jgi:hypothetical protein
LETENIATEKSEQIELTETYLKKMKVYKNQLEELLKNSANIISSSLYVRI